MDDGSKVSMAGLCHVHMAGVRYGCVCAVQAGQVESAIALWKQMRQEGFEPSADTFNAILTACLDCQQNERALTLFQEAQTQGEAGASSSGTRPKTCVAARSCGCHDCVLCFTMSAV